MNDTEEKTPCKCVACAIKALITPDTDVQDAIEINQAAKTVKGMLHSGIDCANLPSESLRKTAEIADRAGWPATANGLRAYADNIDELHPLMKLAIDESIREMSLNLPASPRWTA